MFTVVVSEKGGQPTRHQFNQPEITIGRMKGNDIVLPKGNVSKQHSRIFFRPNGFAIIDLKSTNGTYVNGRKVTAEQAIAETDKIYIGDFILQVDASAAAAQGTGAPAPGAQAAPPMPSAGGFGNATPAFGAPKGPDLRGSDASYSELRMTQEDAMHHVTQPDVQSQPPGVTPSSPNLSATATPYSPSPSAQTPAPVAPAPIAPQPSGGGVASSLKSTVQPRPAQDLLATGVSEVVAQSKRSSGFGRSAHSRAASVVVHQPLQDQSDEAFQAAQQQVAASLLENLTVDELPLVYPPDASQLAQYEQLVQSAISAVNPSVDNSELSSLLTAECTKLGPLESLLDDPEVRDIYVNRFDRIIVRKGNQLEVSQHGFSHPSFLEVAAWRLLGSRESQSGVEEVRFSDGTRVHIILPPIAVDGPLLTLRKPPVSHHSLENLVDMKMLSENMANFLRCAIEAGRSIVIAGPVSSGKTTLLSALGQTLPAGPRVVAIEEASNLALAQKTAIRLEASGDSMRHVLRNALSMHAQYILLDECKGAEAYDWVGSTASGTIGSMLTIHGTSSYDALRRLEGLCLLGSHDVSPRGLREQVARAVNLVVVTNRCANGKAYVQQITEVQGVDLDAFRINDIFYCRLEGASKSFHATGYIPYFYEDLRETGKDVDMTIFQD